MKKKTMALLLTTVFCLTSCSGNENTNPVSYTANPVISDNNMPVQLYNSTISLTTYNQKLLNKVSPVFQKTVENIHKDSDRYNYYTDMNNNRINNLKVINDSYGSETPIKVSDDLYYLLDLSLKLNVLTEGYFNPTMGSLIDLWTKTIPEYPGYGVMDIVGTEAFNKAKNEMIPYSVLDPLSNYIVLNESNKTVTFKKYKDVEQIKISLGGIAKGYGMYKASEQLKDKKDPMMIDGGQSSLILMNDHPKNKTYKIGIASPYSENIFQGQKLLYAVDLPAGTNISTSGDYLHYAYVTDKPCVKDDPVPCQRLKDDLGDGKFRYKRRHHILNPFTGYSENYYRVINIHADGRADVLDALTTALFNIDIVNNRDTFLRVIDNFEKEFNIKIDFLLESEFSFINEDNKEWSNLDVYMSEGMKSVTDSEFKPELDIINSENIIKK